MHYTQEQLNTIATQRNLITQTLTNNPTYQAYGFTTKLGPQDHRTHIPLNYNTPSTWDTQLVQGHTIGNTTKDTRFNWKHLNQHIHHTKIKQLTAGGTGIHPETFTKLANTTPTSQPVNLNLSYGCADVAIAAEWLTKNFNTTTLYPGDAIALLSGNWVSVGLGYYTHLTYPWYLITTHTPTETHRTGWDNPPQHPVAVRDTQPLTAAQDTLKTEITTTLTHEAHKPSGNPLFKVENNQLVAKSNNSYLSLTYTLTLTKWLQYSKILGTWLYGIITHTANSKTPSTLAEEYKHIQTQKTAQATLNILCNLYAPSNFQAADTLENLGDNSIQTLLLITEASSLLKELEDLLVAIK